MAVAADGHPAAFDLLRVPGLARYLAWRHARRALQMPMLLVAALVIYDGFLGPQLAPRNLAGVAPWVQGRGVLVLALLLAGNLICMVCPFMLPRDLAKRILPARRSWPRSLQGKWLAAGLLLAFFWFYETFDPWASPRLTAALAVAYFVGAFAVDGIFKAAAFCKYLCPLGQFNFVNSLVSPLEVKARRPETCLACTTKDCIKGRREQRGCELWLFQERKAGNMDCTFCLDCIHACPHDNVGIQARMPGRELWEDRRRSGVGRFAERPDLAAFVLVLVFASFLNAFGMVGPFYGFAEGLAGLLGTRSEGLVLAAVFGTGLVVLPGLLVGAAAWTSRALARSREPLLAVAVRHSYGLVPVGFGMWLAHYGFHFLTGGLTLLPVAQGFLEDAGVFLFGPPRWGAASLVPASWLVPIELVLLEAGLLGSLVVSYRLAAQRYAERSTAHRAFLPWALLATALFGAGVWLMLQPMEMRGTFGAG